MLLQKNNKVLINSYFPHSCNNTQYESRILFISRKKVGQLMQICFHTTAWKVSKHGVFSGQYFLVFELNTEIYSVFSPNKGKYIPEKTPYLSIFFAQCTLLLNWFKELRSVTEYLNTVKESSTRVRKFWYLLLCNFRLLWLKFYFMERQ